MIKFTKPFLILISLAVLFQLAHPTVAAENHDELFVLIGESLMKAKAGDQATVSKNMNQFAAEWNAIKDTDSKNAKTVDRQLEEVQGFLKKGQTDQEGLSKALSSLSKAVVQYDKEMNPADKAKTREQVKQLLPLIQDFKASIENKNEVGLKADYRALLSQWTAAEKLVHDESITAYGNIERSMALVRIAITQEPVDLNKAGQNLNDLQVEVENFLAGKAPKKMEGNYSLNDVAALLKKAEDGISNEKYKSAISDLNKAITIWPMVEGDVQTRDSKLYSDIETKIPLAISLLSSENIKADKAKNIVSDLDKRLAPLLKKTDYSFWDAALILLREGLEGLLIVATLIAFLKKMGQAGKQKWIWAGVVAGIMASALLAMVINMIFSKITAASSREYIEGITGVVAVVMMLTVGAWLHNKSSIGNWNKYIKDQMQQAIAKGSLLSFALISFLSVFREGAETIIFYAGITPYISLHELAIGIVLAFVILAIVGFAIIHYSVKIPIKLFFRTATILIYLLAFKILGVSIHALQISNMLPTTTIPSMPFIDMIGFYPTLETLVTQLLLLAVIASIFLIARKRNFSKPGMANNI
ncbi:FTR1 family iron permease [Bacillus sp. B-jedd]|uniref:FTR1 family iron permease n=1 Tax=Bacillus sp. B-jedd TaxID=1476857 RepID=UPI000662B883|nr:FTR1 family protein [Bacillus sp. B-jedd]